MIATSAGEDNVGKITNIIGRTVDWSKTNLFVHGLLSIIIDLVLITLGACARVTVLGLQFAVHRAAEISDHFYALVKL